MKITMEYDFNLNDEELNYIKDNNMSERQTLAFVRNRLEQEASTLELELHKPRCNKFSILKISL